MSEKIKQNMNTYKKLFTYNLPVFIAFYMLQGWVYSIDAFIAFLLAFVFFVNVSIFLNDLLSKRIYNEDFYKAVNLIFIVLSIYVLAITYPYVLGFVVIVVLSILLHEAGHLYYMLKYGVKVDEYSIGFGEKLFGFKIRGIQYNFRNILLGGFVRPIDDLLTEDEKKLIKQDKRNLDKIAKKYGITKDQFYMTKPLKQKFWILVGGVLMNIILAYTMLLGSIGYMKQTYLGNHQKQTASTQVKQVKFTSEQIKIIKKQVEEAKKMEDVRKYLEKKVGPTIWLGNKKFTKDDNVYLEGFKEIWKGIELTYYSLKYSSEHPEYFNKFQSVIGIGKTVGEQEKAGFMNIYMLLFIGALVNISLFFLNLLPIPALDGGVLLKEIIAHSISKIGKDEEQLYYRIVLSGFINDLEYAGFILLTGYGAYLMLKDIFIS